MAIPTEDEINVHDSPDERWAVGKYLGKTLAEAEAMLSDPSRNLAHFEDFYHMGPKAVCFYLPALLKTFRVDTEYGYEISSLHFIIDSRLDEGRDLYATALPLLRETVQYILDHWEKFQHDDFSPDGESLRDKFRRMLSDPAKLGLPG